VRADAFKAFLAPRFSLGVVAGHLTNLRTVERVLSLDLDATALDAEAIEGLRARLVAAGMPEPRVTECRTELRHYARFRERRSSQPASGNRSTDTTLAPRATFLSEARTPELMRLYGDVLAELRGRGMAPSGNGPLGDYAALLFARAFGWTLTGDGGATDPKGARYLVRARRVGSGASGRQFGAIRDLPATAFDMLAALLFDRDLGVFRAALVPHAIVVARARQSENADAWHFTLTEPVLDVPSVRDVTSVLRTTALTI
jgi:hypothetical protein